jgi:citrate lyase subunit beta/citryl-CoA lyase
MLLRSLLLVAPGPAFVRAAVSGADALIVDAVGVDDDGLRQTAAFVTSVTAAAVFVRLGPLSAARTTVALDALIPARPAGVVLAGAEGGADVIRLSALLRPREAMAGIDDGITRVIAMATDTPAAMFALGTYAGASRRLLALAGDDRMLAQALGAEDATEITRSVRTGTLLGAATAGVAALDRPFRGTGDVVLAREAEAARRAGFAGKLALNANQVGIINGVFSRAVGSSS